MAFDGARSVTYPRMVADEIRIQIRTPADLEAGVYANFMGVWHTAYEFTLDFAVLLPTEQIAAPDGSHLVAPAKITARIKIPPSLVFNVMRALNENLASYEATFGAVDHPAIPATPEEGTDDQ